MSALLENIRFNQKCHIVKELSWPKNAQFKSHKRGRQRIRAAMERLWGASFQGQSQICQAEVYFQFLSVDLSFLLGTYFLDLVKHIAC